MTARCHTPLAAVAAALLVALLAVSCGRSGPAAGTTPPSGSPPAGNDPGAVGHASCPLGNGSAGASCQKMGSRLADQVLAAIELLEKQKPEIFDFKDEEAPLGSGNYRVLQPEAYIDGVVANLRAAGLCAQRDPDDYAYEKILAKNDNSFSEQFDILLGAGYVWHNGACYRQTCLPASFPVERNPDLPAVGSGCGAPYPPQVHHFNADVHYPGVAYDVLDSTPLVGPDADYCSAIGYVGRIFCPVRPEGSPERVPCENWRVGKATDSKRPGPTWTLNGHYCTGEESGCQNHPENQYQVLAFKSGRYEMCAQNGACGSVDVKR